MIYNGKNVKTAVALGFFDGLHTAHISVLENAAARKSDGLIPCVLLFDEHPVHALKGADVGLLLQNGKRDDILASMGLVEVCKIFNDIKDMSPEQFFENILVNELDAAVICCGYNYHFGKNGAGNTETLKKLCEKYGIKVVVSEEVTADGNAVSSTRIRNLIRAGEIQKANELLGRKFGFISEVFVGDQRGRLNGKPTINQYIPDGLVVPAFGVYASEVYIDGETYIGMTNIGSRPTFGEGSVRSETYIFDYSGDLYGKEIETALLEYIRPEIKFVSADALYEQIKEDEKKVRKFQKKC